MNAIEQIIQNLNQFFQEIKNVTSQFNEADLESDTSNLSIQYRQLIHIVNQFKNDVTRFLEERQSNHAQGMIASLSTKLKDKFEAVKANQPLTEFTQDSKNFACDVKQLYNRYPLQVGIISCLLCLMMRRN